MPELNLDCLAPRPDGLPILCLDFGTAYSKAAIWRADASNPTVLDLGDKAGGSGPMVESSVYLSNDMIYFGPEALRRYRTDNDAERKMFTSPKELLTHQPEDIETDRPEKAIDPTQRFKTRDLLILYLAYLTAVTSESLREMDIRVALPRRFAAPGWHNAQFGEPNSEFEAVARKMSSFLVDAQVLADSIAFEEWRDGIPCGVVLAHLEALARMRDERWRGCDLIQRPVLEAVAAAVGIEDNVQNKRVQVAIVDVGAGTIDVGLFAYVLTDSGTRVHPFRGGLSTFNMAGNYIDRALIALAKSRAELGHDGVVDRKLDKALRDQIRDRKRDLFETGEVAILVDGFPRITIKIDEFTSWPAIKDLVERFKADVAKAIAGPGSSNFTGMQAENLVVFTGGGGRIPFLRKVFQKPFDVHGGERAYFVEQDASPDWVSRAPAQQRDVFPQLAVATGGCSEGQPDEKHAVSDTVIAPRRHLAPEYK